MLEREGITPAPAPAPAPDHEEENEEPPAPRESTQMKPKKLPYFYMLPKKVKEAPKRSREEALDERQRKKDMWHRKSPSRLGRQRGQPDLGARMEVMLEKIQKGHD